MAIEAVGLLDPVKQYLDATGTPLAGGSIAFYQANSTTPQNVYSDYTLTTALPNPVPLNAAGRTSTSTTGTPTAVYLQQKTYDYQVFNASSVSIEGPFTVSGSQWPGQIQGQAILSPAANANGYTNRFTTTIDKASTGVHALFAGTRFDTPTIGAGASTLTEASTVYIEGAPATGTTQNALHVASGTTRLDGTVIIQGQTVRRDRAAVNFRLSLTTGTPVTTANVTAATTLYCTPYGGNLIALYTTDAVWDTFISAEMSIAVPSVLSKMYDVFCYSNSGTPTLELLAWTSDTTRATAITTQDGVYVKSGDATRRYLGSFRTTGTLGQTEDSLTKRYVWNYYNRIMRPLLRQEATATWAYTTATIRQANASTSNQVELVIGVAEVPVNLTLNAFQGNTQSAIAGGGIGEDSTTALSASMIGGGSNSALGAGAVVTPMLISAQLIKYPVVGYHYYAWLEWSTATGTTTWYGTPQGASGVAGSVSGLTGFING